MQAGRRKRIASRLRRLREKAGLTQTEAAWRLDVTNVHLCQVELGNQNASDGLLEKAARLYGVRYGDLVN